MGIDHQRDHETNNSANHAENIAASGGVFSSSNESKSSKATPFSFPFKLHDLLDFAESTGQEATVAWLGSRPGFCILDRRAFEKRVMPLFFGQTKYKSFVRQLNIYGFRRERGERFDSWCYCHPHFVKGRRDLCLSMERVKIRGNGKRRTVSNLPLPTKPQGHVTKKQVSGCHNGGLALASNKEEREGNMPWSQHTSEIGSFQKDWLASPVTTLSRPELPGQEGYLDPPSSLPWASSRGTEENGDQSGCGTVENISSPHHGGLLPLASNIEERGGTMLGSRNNFERGTFQKDSLAPPITTLSRPGRPGRPVQEGCLEPIPSLRWAASRETAESGDQLSCGAAESLPDYYVFTTLYMALYGDQEEKDELLHAIRQRCS